MTSFPKLRDAREERLALARERFFRDEMPEDDELSPLILRSWERCRDSGLDHRTSQAIDPAGRSRLSESRERSARLLELGSGVMEHVFDQIRASGSMVLLADTDGMIIHSLGDAGFVDRAERVSLQPGACWSEDVRGTNGIGTAIAERLPIEVLGAEHYLDKNIFLACNAAPIFDARGKLAGVFDISGDYRNPQRHTLGLVRLSVQLLEKRLFEGEFSNDILLAFHSRPEYIGSLQEGMIAVSPDGAVLGLNPVARDWFAGMGLSLEAADLSDIFRPSLGVILDRCKAAPNSMVRLDLRKGGEIYVQARSQRPLALANPQVVVEQGGSLPHPVRQGSHTAAREPNLDSLCTGDERMQRALQRARRIAGKDIPLLVQGESGVGKEIFAQAFHNSGPRADGPFIALNCAAIPENLIESELFGYAGGAFTGARKEGAIGKVQQAHGGTLFLDEIGDMPLPMQTRLLRVLQERCVTPVGSMKTIPVDISLVCATHRVLREAVASGEFREDLYYRVNGLTVTLPTLRERTDVACLVERILKAETASPRDTPITIGADVMRFFEQYAWPGNIRQLQSVIRVAVALLDDDENVIEAVHLPEELFGADPHRDDAEPIRPLQVHKETNVPPLMDTSPAPNAAPRSLDEIELEAIAAVMREVGGNVSAAARRLGISRNTLYRKLGKIG